MYSVVKKMYSVVNEMYSVVKKIHTVTNWTAVGTWTAMETPVTFKFKP